MQLGSDLQFVQGENTPAFRQRCSQMSACTKSPLWGTQFAYVVLASIKDTHGMTIFIN